VLCFGLHAETIPGGFLQLGNLRTDFTLYGFEGSKVSLLDIDVRGNDYSIQGSATVNPDPFIDYGFTIKNLGAADLSFLFFLSTPYIGGPYSYLTSSHSGSATDSFGLATPINGMVAVTPQAGGIHQPFVDITPYGSIMGGCSYAAIAPGSSVPCGVGNEIGLPIISGITGSLTMILGGTLSAGDVYTFNGLVNISNFPGDEVPEPGTMGIGLLALGMGTYLRRRIAA